MATLYLTLTMVFLTAMTTSSGNPVKMTFAIMALALVIFLWAALVGQNFWFPTLFFLLFMGGILIMFLILSSLLPNQKMTKKQYMVMLAAPLIFLIGETSSSSVSGASWSTGLSQEMPEFLVTTMNLVFLTALVLLYFLTFISMLLTEKSTLRLESCS